MLRFLGVWSELEAAYYAGRHKPGAGTIKRKYRHATTSTRTLEGF